MTPSQDSRLDLFFGCLQGGGSPEELAQLESLLRKDAKFRGEFIRYVGIDTALGRISDRCADPAPRPLRSSRMPGSWRWVSAMAAGLVLGMLTTSLIFGFYDRDPVTSLVRIASPLEVGHDQTTGRIQTGFPTTFGVWSGDETDLVIPEKRESGTALRFLRAEREHLLTPSAAGSCDVYQLVDLSAFQTKTTSGNSILSLSVQFRDERQTVGEPIRFIARVSVFGGKPDSLLEKWPTNRREALASGTSQQDSPGGKPGSKLRVTANVFLPPQSAFAVVHLIANKPDFQSKDGLDAFFGEQFAEDVQLNLRIPTDGSNAEGRL